MLENIKFNYVESENQDELFTPHHRKYDCKIEYKGHRYSFEYQCTPNYLKPNLADCLDCLLNDKASYDESRNVFDFMAEFGYDDVIKGREAYRACKKTSKALDRMFTDEEFDMIYDDLNAM